MEEGILWLRGWHTPDSEEVKAARVAQGIGDQKRVKRPSYRELEQRLQQANAEASNARKLLDDANKRAQTWQRSQTDLHPQYNESYSDAAARKKWGY